MYQNFMQMFRPIDLFSFPVPPLCQHFSYVDLCFPSAQGKYPTMIYLFNSSFPISVLSFPGTQLDFIGEAPD